MEQKEAYTRYWKLLGRFEDYLRWGLASQREEPDFSIPPLSPEESLMVSPLSMDKVCIDCSMAERRMIPPEGPLEAALWVIVDPPSMEAEEVGLSLEGEDRRDFVKWMEAIGLCFPQEVYLQNLTRCRTPGNRPPFGEEFKRCSSYLMEDLRRGRPKAILTLGGNSAAWMTGQRGKKIAQMASREYRWQDIPLFVSYSPAQVRTYPQLKRPVWETLKQLKGLLS